jgi:threonine dehydrogenase-like Zn-dependent dehydrogenase
MRAVEIQAPNEIAVVERPRPEPGEGEVLVRVMASGICGTDVHILRGEYLGDYPVIPGHEFSGVVEAVGTGVSRFSAGDRVAVEPNIACDNCYNCLLSQLGGGGRDAARRDGGVHPRAGEGAL